MQETITITINKEKLPMYFQVQELMSLADEHTENISSLVSENYAELVDILGLEIALIFHTHFTTISRTRYFYTEQHIAMLASQCAKRQDREKLAFKCGCTLQTLDGWVRKSRKGEFAN
jgi:hypothetical protein